MTEKVGVFGNERTSKASAEKTGVFQTDTDGLMLHLDCTTVDGR